MQSSLRLPHSASQARLGELMTILLDRLLLRGDFLYRKHFCGPFCQPPPQSSQRQAAVPSAVPKPPMFPSLPSLNTSSIHCLTCICATFLCFRTYRGASEQPTSRGRWRTPQCARRRAAWRQGAAGHRARAVWRGGGAGRPLLAARLSAAGGRHLAAGAFFKVSAANGWLGLISKCLSPFRQKERGVQIWQVTKTDWHRMGSVCPWRSLWTAAVAAAPGCPAPLRRRCAGRCWPWALEALECGADQNISQGTVQINKSQSIFVQTHIKFMCLVLSSRQQTALPTGPRAVCASLASAAPMSLPHSLCAAVLPAPQLPVL